jgi:predicted signal transduction protein with EAL and GGDEF domain
LRCLEDEGCAQVQGYLISPPRPASEIPAIIRKFGADADAAAAAEQASAPAEAEDSSVAA